jgi:uncharacterized protein (DUF58 family)
VLAGRIRALGGGPTVAPGGTGVPPGGFTVTARGCGVLAGGVVLLVVGFRFGYPDLAVLGAAAAVAALCALAYAVWRPRLDVTRVADPDRVARGEPARMTVTVRNASRLGTASRVAAGLLATTLVATDRCGRRTVPVPLLRLRPGRDTTVSYPVPTDRRGVVPVGPLRVVRGDPLGLVRVARAHGGSARVWVHPRIHVLSAVPAGIARSLDGRIDKVPHGTITFDTLREYVVGDELRRVHWRTSARVGELMVREHLDTSLPRLVVLLDDRADAHPGMRHGVADSFEAACEAAASVVAAAVREDLPVSLHLVVGGAGGGPYLDVLTEAVLHRTTGDPLATATRLLRQQRLGDTLVFLTGPGARDDLGAVGALRGAYPVVVVGILGAACDGQPVPGGEGVIVVDAADGERFAAAWDTVPAW